MKDLLKEAIADAKAVRETALANAKLALEEAFTPRLQSMLSAKLAEEMEEDDDMSSEDEMPADEPTHEEAPEVDDSTEMDEAADYNDDEMSEGSEHDDMGSDEDDLDLESIIRELEMEGDDMESSDTSDVDEMYAEGEDEMSDDEMSEGEMSDDEDVDINEIIASLREEDSEEEETHEEPEMDSSEDLEEAYNVIRFLKGKINEVNLLNAKLLYSNKLFRNFSLNEGQKMKVIENFDRAFNLREVKLVYSTLAESFKHNGSKRIVKESFASKPVASTKPAKQVISEGTELANRFQKLAGLIK